MANDVTDQDGNTANAGVVCNNVHTDDEQFAGSVAPRLEWLRELNSNFSRSAAVLNDEYTVLNISYVLCEEIVVRTVSLDPEGCWIRCATRSLGGACS